MKRMRSECGWSEGSERPTSEARETMPMNGNEVPTTKGSIGCGATESMAIICVDERTFFQHKITSPWRYCLLVGRVSLRAHIRRRYVLARFVLGFSIAEFVHADTFEGGFIWIWKDFHE